MPGLVIFTLFIEIGSEHSRSYTRQVSSGIERAGERVKESVGVGAGTPSRMPSKPSCSTRIAPHAGE